MHQSGSQCHTRSPAAIRQRLPARPRLLSGTKLSITSDGAALQQISYHFRRCIPAAKVSSRHRMQSSRQCLIAWSAASARKGTITSHDAVRLPMYKRLTGCSTAANVPSLPTLHSGSQFTIASQATVRQPICYHFRRCSPAVNVPSHPRMQSGCQATIAFSAASASQSSISYQSAVWMTM